MDDTARFPGGARPGLSVGTADFPASIPNIYETPPSATGRAHSSGSASPSPGPSRSPSPQRHRPQLTSLQTSTSSFRDEHPSGSNETARPTLQLFGLASPVRQDIQAALEELRNLELDEFLDRTSKSMEEVRFDEPSHADLHLPGRAKYRDPLTGRVDYLRFVEAWACTYADLHLPPDLLSTARPAKFSLSRTRVAVERLYVLVPPKLVEQLIAGDLVNLYRWVDPLRTAKWALGYLACWWHDQIPAAIFFFIVYQILKPQIWPPSPSEIRQQLLERRALSGEAKAIDEDDNDKRSKRESAKRMSQSIASSVGIATMMSGINIHAGPKTLERSMTPDLDDSSSSTDDTTQIDTSGTPKKAKTSSKNKHRGKRGMYRLIKELIARFGPIIEMLIQDQADLAEKAKNLFLWRRPKACKQSLCLIGAWALFLSILPGYLQLKLLLLWAWFQFFVIWPLQDRYPRYRRALNPLWYLLWNVPNDAECAMEVLRERATKAQAAQEDASEIADRRSLSVSDLPRNARTKSLSSLSQISLALTDELDGQPVEGKHFAIYRGVPGNLILTSAEVYFNSMKGLRSLSARIFKGSSATGKDDASKATTLFRHQLSTVTLVKKESRFEVGFFDTDGLHIAFNNGKSVRLASVSKRDEAFAFILAHSTNQRLAAK